MDEKERVFVAFGGVPTVGTKNIRLEIALWFKDTELVTYNRAVDKWILE